MTENGEAVAYTARSELSAPQNTQALWKTAESLSWWFKMFLKCIAHRLEHYMPLELVKEAHQRLMFRVFKLHIKVENLLVKMSFKHKIPDENRDKDTHTKDYGINFLIFTSRCVKQLRT